MRCVIEVRLKMCSTLYKGVMSLNGKGSNYVVERIKRLKGADRWLEEFDVGDEEARVALLLRKERGGRGLGG